ncbi:MAG: cytochrome-c peroxidase [Chitinophagales bacterium]|nr:cytochrome-c peroxidase [Chitinophagales bacterium]
MKSSEVNTRGKNTILIVLFIIVTCLTSVTTLHHKTPNPIEALYKSRLSDLRNRLESFKKAADQKEDIKALKSEFLLSRITYKKLAVFTDYFNEYETRFLNGPPISRIESEVADRILAPEGFQAIEELIYNEPEKGTSLPGISKLIGSMLEIITRLEKEPDLTYKFKDELVWDAMRSTLVRVMTLSIAGFDSQAAVHSLQEASASIQSIREILNFYKKEISEKIPGGFNKLETLLSKCSDHLNASGNFNKFDRLSFLTDYMNPLYSCFIETRIGTGIDVPAGRSSVNYASPSIFDEDAFNINFYSPPEEYWVNNERIDLGKKIFYDPILSGTKTRSCASCHQPDKAFTDGLVTPYSLDSNLRLKRNTPTLLNSGFQTKQFYDSRTDILENQLAEVVHNTEEMDGSLKKSVDDLKRSDSYPQLFKKAYPKEKDPINTFTVANAIASYVRSLRSLNSRFDQYVRGDKSKMNEKEKKGFNLFMGKGKCATCHFLPLFNGVVPPLYADTESEVLGVPASKDKKNAIIDDDPGKFLFTGSVIHKYAFKTPTLRNIELTGPYMHNGVYSTLEEVMEFYNNGGGKGLHIAPENQTLPFDKLTLSKKEIRQIISFMKTLTDTTALQ